MTERSLQALFERARPHLEAALERSPDGLSIEAVKSALDVGAAQLWLGENSAGVTEVMHHCNVWLLGGRMDDVEPLLHEVETKARAAGLDFITILEGRKGWERVLGRHGFKRRSVLMKEL